MSVEEGAPTAQCAFCGNTVVVPAELRRPASSGASEPAPPHKQSSIFVGGMPLLDQLPKLREMGDLARSGRLAEAARLYQEMFGANEQEANSALDQLAAGQPVTVHHVTAGQASALDSAGFFRFDGAGLPQIQIGNLGSAGFNAPIVTSTMTTYASPPVVVTHTPRRRAGGCLATLIILGVVGALVVGLLSVVVTFLPLLALPGLDKLDEIVPGLADAVADGTGQYPRVVLEFGGEGTGIGRFSDARHVGVDAEGNIYVADYSGGRLQVFDPQGEFVTQWQVGDGGDDVYLTGMAVARDGSVYLVYGSDLFRHDGQTGEVISQIDYIDGWGFGDVAALPGGGLVAAWYKNRDDIIAFDEDGNTVMALREAISSITGDTEVTIKVAADGLGNIYAVGQLSEAIFHFSPSGDYVNRFSSSGDEPGQLSLAGDIAVDNQSRVYVSDLNGILAFAPDGRYLSTIPTSAFAYGLAFDDDNYLYVVSNNKVFKYQLEADE
ncbi:MAG: hypothetical protein IT318_27480 [Anaerolineales bacterium]|nr:hypothetical protein [Anaerolineales bacterium]